METEIQAWWFYLKAKLEILQYFSVYCTFLTLLTGFQLIFLAKLTCIRRCHSSLPIFTLSKARLQVNIS